MTKQSMVEKKNTEFVVCVGEEREREQEKRNKVGQREQEEKINKYNMPSKVVEIIWLKYWRSS